MAPEAAIPWECCRWSGRATAGPETTAAAEQTTTENFRAGHRHNGSGDSRVSPAPSLCLQLCRKSRYGRLSNSARAAVRASDNLPKTRNNLGSQQRMAAQVEEIVVCANLLELQALHARLRRPTPRAHRVEQRTPRRARAIVSAAPAARAGQPCRWVESVTRPGIRTRSVRMPGVTAPRDRYAGRAQRAACSWPRDNVADQLLLPVVILTRQLPRSRERLRAALAPP